MSDAPVTLFIPFGSGYGNPGLTLRAETVKELNATMLDLKEEDEEGISLLDSLLSEVVTIKAAVLLKFPQEESQARNASSTRPANVPDASSTPKCDHGAMKYREGQNAKGPWKGYFCPQPYGQQQCKPQFIK